MSLDFEQRLRTELMTEPVPFDVDEHAVLARGRASVRLRAVARTLAGVAVLAVAIPVVSLLVAEPVVVPSVLSPTGAATTVSPLPSSAWLLSSESGGWAGPDPVITLVIDGSRTVVTRQSNSGLL